MRARITSMLSTLRNSPKLKAVLIILLVILVGLYAFSIPMFASGNLFPHSNYICYAFVGILGITAIFSTLLYSTFKVRPVLFLIPAFALFAFLGTAIYSHEYRPWLTLVLMAVVVFILFYAFNIINNKKLILLTIISAFALFSIVYIVVLRKEIFVLSNYGRIGEPFEHPNTLSFYMVIPSIITLYSIYFFKKKLKCILIAPLVMFVFVGLTTGSRAFFIFFIIVFLVLSIFRFRKNKWALIGILSGLVVLVVVLLTIPALSNLRFRLFNGLATIFGASSQPDNSVLQRLAWFEYGFNLGGQKLLTGYGVDGFAIYSGVKTYSHANLSEIVCNFGVIGTILFYCPLLYLLFTNIKKRSGYSPLIFAFTMFMLVASFANVYYYNKIYYFAIVLVLYVSVDSDTNNIELIANS